MKSCALLILLFYAMRDTTASPLRIRRDISTHSEEELTSDAGPVGSCVLPTAPVCGIDYLVPESVAVIAPAIEKDIAASYDNLFELRYGSASCRETAETIVCAQRFPRCEVEGDSVQVTLTSLDCENMLVENCGIYAGKLTYLCALQNSTHNATECKSLAEHVADAPVELQNCTVDQQWRMTAWMFEQLKYYDSILAETLPDLKRVFPNCVKHQMNFTCQLVGRCSEHEDGERVELINTYEICQNFINCFSDSYATILRQHYDCDHWPHRIYTPPSTPPPTPHSTPPTSSMPPSSSTPTQPDPGDVTVPTWPSPPPGMTDPVVNMVTGGALVTLPLHVALLIASPLLQTLIP